MVNRSLYIQKPWDAPNKKRELDVATKGISEYHDDIFDLDKRKVKMEDVPPMYRKNRKRDIALKTLIIADVLFSLNFILFFAHIITERM